MSFRNSILAGEELIRSGMRSPNYVAGTAGWRIAKDGSAELNNVTVRGAVDWSGGTLDEHGLVLVASPGLVLPIVSWENPRQVKWVHPLDEEEVAAYMRALSDFGIPPQLEVGVLDATFTSVAAAIRFDANDGTVEVIGDGVLLPTNGDPNLPDLRWASDLNCGVRLSGTDQVDLVAGGAVCIRLHAADPYVQFPNLQTTAGGANVNATTNGNLRRSTSSRRIKRDIADLGHSVVDQLRPVAFRAKPDHVAEGDDPNRVFVGLIAEEVAEADPRLAQLDDEGQVVYFDTVGLIAHLVAHAQELAARVAALEAQLLADPADGLDDDLADVGPGELT